VSGVPRGRWRWSSGVAVLLSTAFLAAVALPAPRSAREHVVGGALLLVTILAGLLLVRIERRARALEDAYRGALEIAARLIDSLERFSENHSRRVAESAVEMALALGLTGTDVEDVRVGGLLHDLATLDIPAESLALAAGITPEELDDTGLRLHGDVRSARTPGGTLRRVIPMVACSRERWDGTGRRSLRGPEIPLGARIIAVADAYDSMVTDRAHRKGRTHEAALAALQEASGTQFDPQAVDVFLQLHATPGGDTALPWAA
jgi:HD-GYP domain-containing protein (c-di-GMP phosphodiesterase class II)